jgi:tetratricopeptide (TPR) repeat protein
MTVLLAALSGCATTATETAEAEPPPPAPAGDLELTLNLPEQPQACRCADAEEGDRTFLERGVSMLAGGDYIEAVQYFQRYRRLEKQPLAQWEARLAIAYVSMLPSSPFYDVDAARRSYLELQEAVPEGRMHDSVVLMRQALETFMLMERHIDDLENRADMLSEDLQKREQALRRLRELTLGQPAGGR